MTEADGTDSGDGIEAARIAEEEAALRRVATMVARGASVDGLFTAVNEEIARLVGADWTAIMRFEPGDAVTLVAAWSAGDASVPVGMRRPLDDALRWVRESGRPLRSRPGQGAPPSPLGVQAGRAGLRSFVGVPIVVDDHVWGASWAEAAGPDPFREGTEERIAQFIELVTTAIANAQARSELRQLVEEHRALRHVATLVARGASQADVFDAVVWEAYRLFGEDVAFLLRYESDGTPVIAAISGAPAKFRPGTRLSREGDGVPVRVWRTGRAARLDSYENVSGPDAARARSLGVRGSAGAPIVVAGRVWGVIVVMTRGDVLPVATEGRLAQFAELVAAAIANAESRAELTASRARVVAAADETRRRIQRDVHDGAQQRLVHTVISLKLLKQALDRDGGKHGELVDEALQNAQRANAELRELTHGIMPAALSRGGLRAGVESLVSQMSLPVTVDVLDERLPAQLEATAYFVIAEALTNAVKHARAGSARVRAVVDGETVRLEISDDGMGGADPARGSGLVGLADRVAAGGGSLAITSPPGEGTTVAVELPAGQP